MMLEHINKHAYEFLDYSQEFKESNAFTRSSCISPHILLASVCNYRGPEFQSQFESAVRVA